MAALNKETTILLLILFFQSSGSVEEPKIKRRLIETALELPDTADVTDELAFKSSFSFSFNPISQFCFGHRHEFGGRIHSWGQLRCRCPAPPVSSRAFREEMRSFGWTSCRRTNLSHIRGRRRLPRTPRLADASPAADRAGRDGGSSAARHREAQADPVYAVAERGRMIVNRKSLAITDGQPGQVSRRFSIAFQEPWPPLVRCLSGQPSCNRFGWSLPVRMSMPGSSPSAIQTDIP